MKIKHFFQQYSFLLAIVVSIGVSVFLAWYGVSATTVGSDITTAGLTATGAVNASSTLQVTGAIRFYGGTTVENLTINGTCSGCGVATAGGWTDTGSVVRLATANDLVEIGTTASTTIGAALSVTSTTSAAILFALKGVSGQTGDFFRILDSSDNVLSVFNAAGGLGIGTTSPGFGLGVATTSGFTATSTLFAGLITPHISATSTLNFYTAGGAPRMVIDSSGNVGISTTTPAQEVSLVGDTYHSSGATTTITVYSTSGTQGGCIEIEQPATAGGWVRIYAGSGSLATSSSGASGPGLVFQVGRCQ